MLHWLRTIILEPLPALLYLNGCRHREICGCCCVHACRQGSTVTLHFGYPRGSGIQSITVGPVSILNTAFQYAGAITHIGASGNDFVDCSGTS